MRIGRLYINLIGFPEFGTETFPCKRKCLTIGFIYFIWADKDCKCSACKQYECICRCEWCDQKYSKCECGDESA